MVIVLDRHEAEGLQNAVRQLSRGSQDFCHAVYGSGLRLERDFHEVALSQRMGQAQQASGHGNGLEFGFSAAAIFQPDRSQDRISQLDSCRAPRRVRLGEMSHSLTGLSHDGVLCNRLLRPLVRIPALEAAIRTMEDPSLQILTSLFTDQ
jgi:hypothetical protein